MEHLTVFHVKHYGDNMKNKHLYDENGYINIRAVLSYGMPFNFLVGGRAIGKTFTALETAILDKHKFILMRRTQKQNELISKPEFSPLKPVNNKHGWTYEPRSISKDNSAFYPVVQDADGKTQIAGQPIGITCALSTISSMRGFDASDIDLLIYDEFIPETHERPIKNEGQAFLNAYETINRNRELQGKKPLTVLALANSNNLANDIFITLGLVKKCEEMSRTGQEISIMSKRGIGIFMFSESPISEKKKTTALYKLSGGTDFAEMSLSNHFVDDVSINKGGKPLIEYTAIVTVGDMTIYRHKSNYEFYCCYHLSGSCPRYDANRHDLIRFRKAYIHLVSAYFNNQIYFEDYSCQVLLEKYLDIL